VMIEPSARSSWRADVVASAASVTSATATVIAAAECEVCSPRTVRMSTARTPRTMRAARAVATTTELCLTRTELANLSPHRVMTV
jgi:hypothetical protein